MSITYKELIELVAQREMGILGRPKTFDLFASVGLDLDASGSLVNDESKYSREHLELLLKTLNDTYGPVAVMGCKIALSRKAKEGGLPVPLI